MSVCLDSEAFLFYLQNLDLQTYFPSYRPTLSLPTSLTKFEVGVEIPVRIYYIYIVLGQFFDVAKQGDLAKFGYHKKEMTIIWK